MIDHAHLVDLLSASLLGAFIALPWRWILIGAIAVIFVLWVIATILARASTTWYDPTSVAGRFVHPSTRRRPRWPRS